MTSTQRSVQVYVDTAAVASEPALMGTLHAQSGGSQEIFSFEYDPEWLGREQAFAFDPDLQLLGGPQNPAQSRNNFGIFLDSSPDRWGRLLMQRRENLRARQEGRKPRRLIDWD
jgi:serine/threonine-protein kinase HipA